MKKFLLMHIKGGLLSAEKREEIKRSAELKTGLPCLIVNADLVSARVIDASGKALKKRNRNA